MKLLVPIVLLALCGCNQQPPVLNATTQQVPSQNSSFDVIIIDGCQYVVGFREFTHKGNCTNATHHRVELVETYVPITTAADTKSLSNAWSKGYMHGFQHTLDSLDHVVSKEWSVPEAVRYIDLGKTENPYN